RTPPFEPIMMTAVHLQHLPKTTPTLTPHAMRCRAVTLPMTGRDPPTPERLGMHHQLVLLRKAFRRQRRTVIGILTLAHRQHPRPQARRQTPVARLAPG